MTESLFGFKTVQKDLTTVVSAIVPDSVADEVLSKDDELIAVDGRKIANNLEKLIQGKTEISLAFFRNNRLLTKKLSFKGSYYYKQFLIVRDVMATDTAKNNFSKWSRNEW